MVEVNKALAEDTSATSKVDGAVKVYADGGASHPADPRLRRSGWGVWVEEGHPLNCHGVVPGIEQTAGRAELYAAVKVMEIMTDDIFLSSTTRLVVTT
eukprot:5349372-Heterocapsa_arctica.AAC.1